MNKIIRKNNKNRNIVTIYVGYGLGLTVAGDRSNRSRRERPFGGTKFRRSEEGLDGLIGRA